MLTKKNKRFVALAFTILLLMIGLTVTYIYRAAKDTTEERELVDIASRIQANQEAIPERPKGVPLATRWAASGDGGAWIECRIDPQRNRNHCVSYNYQTGQVLTDGYYFASDTKMAAQNSELVFNGFDGARIYLANGRVLEPAKEPMVPIARAGTKCKNITYYSANAGDADGEYCYAMQKWLIEASLHGNMDQIRKALARGAHIEATYYSSLPALQVAAMKGHTDAAILLLDSGADVNRVVSLGNTALSIAVFEGHADVVRLLLDRGAEVCDSQGHRTMEEIAQKQGDVEILRMLKAARTSNCK